MAKLPQTVTYRFELDNANGGWVKGGEVDEGPMGREDAWGTMQAFRGHLARARCRDSKTVNVPMDIALDMDAGAVRAHAEWKRLERKQEEDEQTIAALRAQLGREGVARSGLERQVLEMLATVRKAEQEGEA